MKIKHFLLGTLIVLSIVPSLAQELKTAPEDKALVYIARISGLGAAINFKYFIGDRYIGKFNDANYIVLECEPGEHLFWASSENGSFLPASLEAGKVYVIEAEVKMGGMKARVELTPLNKDDQKTMDKSKKLIAKKQPFELDQAKTESEGVELKDFIDESLQRYKTKLEKGEEFATLESETSF